MSKTFDHMSEQDKLFADNKENNKRLRAAAKSQGMKTARQKDREFLNAQEVSTTDRSQILADLRRLAKALKAHVTKASATQSQPPEGY